MNPAAHFAHSYAEARGKFHAAARANDLALEAHPLPDRAGVVGEPLSMDVALLGDPHAPNLLLLSSGTHGIEGYCGSGVQIALLHDDDFLRAVEGSGAAVLFVHAVNPHGFSYGRRVNEDNADLNRNFRDHSTPVPANPAYAEVHPLLLPERWPAPATNEAKIAAYIALNGKRAFQSAVTTGQYDHPDGLCYGGSAPAWSNVTLREILRRHAASRARFAWIDFHTGLGPRGHGEKIYNGRDDAAGLARTRRWFGTDVTSIYDESSVSAQVTGIIGNAPYEECPDALYAGIGLEFGTAALLDVLQALRADHWLYQHPEAPLTQRVHIRAQMRDAFYVDTDEWKQQVYAQSKTSALRAFGALGAEA